MRTALADRFIGSLLSDAAVLEAPLYAGRERSSAADLLVRLSEIDVRQLYLAAGHTSLSAYCMEELQLSGDEAANRIYVARTARRFPILFEAIDEGGVDLTGARLLASHLTEGNADELIAAAAACRHKSDLQTFLQHRFAEPDRLRAPALMAGSDVPEHASGPATQVVQSHVPEHVTAPPADLPLGSPPEHIPLPVEGLEFVDLKVKARRAKWQRVRDLLSHSVPNGDASVIFDRALDALIEMTEKKKIAACSKPRAPRPKNTRERCIPAAVRRAVWERDDGQCTFVSESRRRCKSRRKIEFDHVKPVARGGKASVEGLRLLCRPHNQYEAEQALGAEFMKHQREKARKERAKALAPPPGHRFRDHVMAGLRALGLHAGEARQIVERSGALQQATLEESMRAALRCCGPQRGARSG
jgi:hypothetical protein